MRLSFAALLGLVVAVAGCGSSPSYADTVRPAIQTMAKALRTYNSARPTDVGATARSCSAAAQSLAGDDSLVTASPPQQYLKLSHALSQAYSLALSGFRECAAGDYPHMIQAAADLAQANGWISQAKHLDR